jgi:penicillin-binding protein 2
MSCDIYFYKVGGGYEGEVKEGLGIDRLAEYAKALGYGQATGIELPGEGDGLSNFCLETYQFERELVNR